MSFEFKIPVSILKNDEGASKVVPADITAGEVTLIFGSKPNTPDYNGDVEIVFGTENGSIFLGRDSGNYSMTKWREDSFLSGSPEGKNDIEIKSDPFDRAVKICLQHVFESEEENTEKV